MSDVELDKSCLSPVNSIYLRNTSKARIISLACLLFIRFSFSAGQLVVASLISRNIKSRLLLRDPEKALSLFGRQDEDRLKASAHFCIIFVLCFFMHLFAFYT